ncbi:MAG: ribosome silencing factor, partial [Gammaproteobacteria bacterium]|nr:ribosome silencing factor [Gammaproteobacteria bacterium]
MHIDTLKKLAVDALEELKARDITHLDVAKLTEV